MWKQQSFINLWHSNYTERMYADNSCGFWIYFLFWITFSLTKNSNEIHWTKRKRRTRKIKIRLSFQQSMLLIFYFNFFFLSFLEILCCIGYFVCSQLDIEMRILLRLLFYMFCKIGLNKKWVICVHVSAVKLLFWPV